MPPTTGRPTRGRAAAAVLVLILLGYLAHAGLFLGQVNDDAFITFRYSRNLAAGRGPYYNPGEHVEGYTNFLLMVLVAPAIALGGEEAALPAAKAIGLAGGLLCLVLVFLLPRAAGPLDGEPDGARTEGLLAAALLASSPSFAVNSTTGLETTLFAALLTAGAYLGTRSLAEGRWLGAGAAWAAAALTRPEGIFIFAVFQAASLPAAMARRETAAPLPAPPRRRWPARPRHPLTLDALVVGAAFVAHMAFRLAAYDGEWLPNTYFAKPGGFWLVTPWLYLRQGTVTALLGPAGIVVAAAGLAWRRRPWRIFLPGLAAALAGTLLPFAVGTDWMVGQRLLMPYLPLAAWAAASGWTGLLGRLLGSRRWPGRVLLVLAAAAAIASQDASRRSLRDYVSTRAAGYRAGHQALARWIGSESVPGQTVALMDIGLVGYFLPDLRILDITGLTDRAIARSPGTFLKKKYQVSYVLDRRPDFLVIVYGASGDPSLPPPPGTRLVPWTGIESRIVGQPDFARLYADPKTDTGGGDWKEALARRLGAERIFEHRHPGLYYLLAVYRLHRGRPMAQAAGRK